MSTHTQLPPLFLSPALPSDLLQFVINRYSYPTTLIICADRAEFLSSLTQDLILQQEQQQPQSQPQPHTADKPHDTAAQQATADPSHQDQDQDTRHPLPAEAAPPRRPQPQPQPQPQSPPPHPVPPNPKLKPHPLLTPSLSQLSTTRHLRTVFVPTVSHLRAFLSVFSVDPPFSGKVPPPPPALSVPGTTTTTTTARGRGERVPRLVVLDFLSLHRHTSEWSVQGLGASSALLAEAGRRVGLGVVVVESRGSGSQQGMMAEVLGERVPVLSGSARRELGWAGKTVDVGRVLGRWFRFREWHGYTDAGG